MTDFSAPNWGTPARGIDGRAKPGDYKHKVMGTDIQPMGQNLKLETPEFKKYDSTGFDTYAQYNPKRRALLSTNLDHGPVYSHGPNKESFNPYINQRKAGYINPE